MQKNTTTAPERSAIYLLVCQQPDGRICIPPFSAFEPDEAQTFFDEESEEPSGSLYGCKQLHILKAFEMENGQVVWANREAVGPGPALFITLDSGCHGSPYIDFNNLLPEGEADLDSLWTARIY